MRIAHGDVGELALEQPDQLGRERVALVVGVALERQPEHRHLAVRERADPPLDPLDQEQRHGLVDPRDREQHARRRGALLREREVLAQARAGGHARLRDPAAGIVAVDQVDHVEHVGAVPLAVHHQQVRERERRVAEDVRPDLGELGLDRRGPDDRGAEHRERARRALGRGLADAADDARERRDLLDEPSGGDPLRRVRDEQVLADAQPASLLQIAGDELGRAGRDRRAEDQGVAGAQHREQVVDRRPHLAQVALDVRERRGPDRDHDVVGAGGVDGALGELEAPARDHALEQLLGAGLVERHPAGADRGEHRLVVVDADHAQPAVGEAQRERQPHAPETDHRHRPRSAHEKDLRRGRRRRWRRPRSPPTRSRCAGASGRARPDVRAPRPRTRSG